jgi:hypothetical protein
MMGQVPDEGGTPGSVRGGGRVWGLALKTLRALGAALVVLVFALAYMEGLFPNALSLLILFMAPATLLARLWGAIRKRLEFGLIRHPFARASRPYLLQCLNRWMFWGMAGLTLALSLVPIQFEPGEYRAIWLVLGLSLGVLLILQLVPPRRVRLVGNIPYALGWVFLGVEWLRVLSPLTASDGVLISPPFRGEWYVFQGGRSALVNHHYPIRAQRYALDLVMTVGGRESKGDPDRLESYPAYGQPLYAPADGRVSRVTNDRPDMAIGETDTEQIVGNHVVIDLGGGRWVLLAHLMKGSVLVSEGQRVRRGEAIARCGNSGNTSAPHLHLQVQDGPDFEESDLASLPIRFRDTALIRWGQSRWGTIGDARRNDRLISPPP